MSTEATAPEQVHGKELSPRHERFALLMATGDLAAWEAYQQCYPRAEESTCRTKGPELVRNSHIRERIRNIQNGEAKATSMTLEEWRAWHEGVMRTPVADIDETHMLAQEVTYEIQGGQRGKLKVGAEQEEGNEISTPPVLVKRVKMVSKIDSSRELAKHHGWTTEKHEVRTTVAGLAELLASIVKPGLPQEPKSE